MNDELERFLAAARGTAATAKIRFASRSDVDDLRRGAPESHARWSLAPLRGRLVEVSARGASAALTAATELVIEAQTQGEPVAWLALANGSFYPPDLAESGVDLAALVVIRALDATALARAAERLLRSGAFGLVVFDLASADLSTANQGRLVTLAQTHDAAIVCLTDKSADAASLGSLVSLRVEALRVKEPGSFGYAVCALKDKRRGPGWTHGARRRGPAGL